MADLVNLEAVEYTEKLDSKPEKIIFLLHGYGADANDLIGLAPIFAKAAPNAIFYSIHAPESLENQGLFMMGRQWFSLAWYAPSVLKDMNKNLLDEMMKKMHEGAMSALPSLHRFIKDKIQKHSLTHKDVIIAGFSQGGLMSLYAGLCLEEEVAGIIGMSAVPVYDNILPYIKSKPTVLLAHGDADEVVPYGSTDLSRDVLAKSGIENRIVTSNDMGHSIDDTVIIAVSDFIAYKFA